MTEIMMFDAVVLAGQRNDGAFQAVSDAPNEALIEIGGRTMLDYVLSALQGAGRVDRIVVVGTPEVEAALPAGVEYQAAGDEIIDNVLHGLGKLASDRLVMVVTSDIPLLTPVAVDDLAARCAAQPADIYYPAIPRAAAERGYPGVERTYVKLREGTFTGGNIFVVNPRVAPDLAARLKAFVDARKSPAKMAGLLGPGFAIKLMLGALSTAELEAKVAGMFGVRGAVVFTEYAEIGVDVDKLTDLELAKRVLAQ
ncbi:MAG: nucleotidyltransferase family protein [Firmicutes bacterium]|nr:nucleotidyltransferase family protein [Bacillota bacterium]